MVFLASVLLFTAVALHSDRFINQTVAKQRKNGDIDSFCTMKSGYNRVATRPETERHEEYAYTSVRLQNEGVSEQSTEGGNRIQER